MDFMSILGTIFYALCGIMLYPSIGPSSQGQICTEDSTEEFCGTDQRLKLRLSVALICWNVFAIGFCVWISIQNIRENMFMRKAQKLLPQLLPMSSTLFEACSRRDACKNTRLIEGQYASNDETQQRSLEVATIFKGHVLLNTAYKTPTENQEFLGRSFKVLKQGVHNLEEDVTQHSCGYRADVLRKLFEHMPFLLDWLTQCPEEQREAMSIFVEGYCNYCYKLNEEADPVSHFGLPKPPKSQYRDLVVEELAPCLLYTLLQADWARHQSIVHALRSLQDPAGPTLLKDSDALQQMQIKSPPGQYHTNKRGRSTDTKDEPLRAVSIENTKSNEDPLSAVIVDADEMLNDDVQDLDSSIPEDHAVDLRHVTLPSQVT
uniref:Uncharacterized protein n=1 Tax=Eutreptiella gymnastica TaxID=73025 RepID=A0A7S1HTX3_9EUGL